MTLSPFGERSLTLVAASFDDRAEAERIAALLRRDGDVHGEVTVLGPGDPMAARKLEPEQAGIWHTLLRSHLLFGLLGALAGAGVAALLVRSWEAAAHSPGFTVLFLGVMGAFLGMMVGGLVTLRPDHDRVIERVHQALRRGQWAVVVHPADAAGADTAYSALEKVGAAAVRSL